MGNFFQSENFKMIMTVQTDNGKYGNRYDGKNSPHYC